MKKRRLLAGILAGCMLMGQTAFAEEAVTDEQSYMDIESGLEEVEAPEEQEEATDQESLETDQENVQNDVQEQRSECGDQEQSEEAENNSEVQKEDKIPKSSPKESSPAAAVQQQNEIEEVSLGKGNGPVLISTEISEAGETVRYRFQPEKSGGYYIDLMDQGQFSVYEETIYGEDRIDGAASTGSKYGSVVFSAEVGTTYYIDVSYNDAGSVGTINWKLGRP